MSGIGPKHVAPSAMPVKCRFCDKTIRKDSMEKHCNTVHKDIVTKERPSIAMFAKPAEKRPLSEAEASSDRVRELSQSKFESIFRW